MKHIKIVFGLVILLGLASCTKDFNDINTDPNGVTQEEASARYFITNPQYNLYAPNRFPYWRATLIHTDRYAGHITFGFKGSWWGDNLGYSYSGGYTDAVWGWLATYIGQLDNFMKLTAVDGDFENEYMYATGLIIKGLYFQMFTDVFGEIPYSEAADTSIVLPKFDMQKDIYKGIIADLDQAMAVIGDATTSGDGIQDLGDNDLYCKGDMQKWKKLANTLKLRIALRANGASGDDFSTDAINQALTAGLFLESFEENVLLKKDAKISTWGSASYGDVWHDFGGKGSKWHVGEVLVNYLQDYNDPRLSKYAEPVQGGIFGFKQPELTAANADPHNNFFERTRHIRDKIAYVIGSTGFYEEFADSVAFTIPENTYYIGQPTRLASEIYDYTLYEFFSEPGELVIQKKKEEKPLYDEIILTTAESYFLRAEAVVKGFGSGDAQALFTEGIRHAMLIWGVTEDEASTYLAGSSLAQLTGTDEQKIEKISIQRWLATYTDGFEAWSIVRKSGYPSELANGVSNNILYYIGGDIGAAYPKRMRYGSEASATNGTNLGIAIGRQGADLQTTELWFAK